LNPKDSEAKIKIWYSVFFNPNLFSLTEQLKKDLKKQFKINQGEITCIEELTAFLSIEAQLQQPGNINSQKILGEENLKTKMGVIKQFYKQLAKINESYTRLLFEKFLKNLKNNKEFKETKSLFSNEICSNAEEKSALNNFLTDQIGELALAYRETIAASPTLICYCPDGKKIFFQFNDTSFPMKSKSPPEIQFIDLIILYHFSQEFLLKTIEVIDNLLSILTKHYSYIKKISNPSPKVIELLKLLRGKAFEVIDNIQETRRQLAKQNNVCRTLSNDYETFLKSVNQEEIIEEHLEDINSALHKSQEILDIFEQWHDVVYSVTNVELKTKEKTLANVHQELLKELFVQMELTRIWSEFFYDLTYYSIRREKMKGTTSDLIEGIEDNIVLFVSNIYKTYRLPNSRVYALRGVNFKVKKGEFIAIMGPSGAGKTTLINILTGLDTPDKGKIFLNKQDISQLSDKQLTEFRRNEIGFVFQFYQLFGELTALENVALPAEMANKPIREIKKRAQALLKVVDLEKFANQFPDKLSGGQQQRVAIARSLINDPSIIVADQLTGDLDSVTGKQIIGYLRKINQEKKTTILLATHNKNVANQADRILVIRDGEIIEEIDMELLRAKNSI
jgi:putative ABC transport system ATP-binding protein